MDIEFIDKITALDWSENEIVFPNAAMYKKAFKFIREAILDRYLYNTRVIGFRFTESSYAFSRGMCQEATIRHMQVGDAYPEMILNLKDKVFLSKPNGDSPAVMRTQVGVNYLPERKFSTTSFSENKTNYSVLFTNPYVCRIAEAKNQNIDLYVRVAEGCGYVPMEVNSKLIPKDYFPCYTDYSLTEFVRVLPPDKDSNKPVIKFMFRNGMTSMALKGLFINYSNIAKQGRLDMKGVQWLQHI